MLKLITLLLNLFTLFIFGIFISFPIAAIFGAIATLVSWLPMLWAIFRRTGLGLMILISIALFLKAVKN
ncbi:MAG: hypothetical protein NT070_20985 [Cyanobacteria bacterium]|nr:hypothetical protein [Cyanobacteriota bacterium]